MLPRPPSTRSPRGIDDFDLVTEQYWVLHDDVHRRPGHHHPGGPGLGSVAPPVTLAGDLDPPVGPAAGSSCAPRATGRHPGRPERAHDHRTGPAVGQPLNGRHRRLRRRSQRHTWTRFPACTRSSWSPSPTWTLRAPDTSPNSIPASRAERGRPAGRRAGRPGAEPDDPRRPRRDRAAGDRRRQARLRREAAGGHDGARPRHPRPRHKRPVSGRVRTGHRAGHRHPDRPQSHRRRR